MKNEDEKIKFLKNVSVLSYENYEKYGIDKNRIAVGGDSAGGNLALSTAIKARNSGLNWIKALVLAYPCTVKCDATMDGYVWS